MPHLSWSRRASADLDRLDAFLREKSPRAADEAMARIVGAADLLTHFPEAGRDAKKYGPYRRELPVSYGDSGYIILYRYAGDEVVVASVRHMREANYQP